MKLKIEQLEIFENFLKQKKKKRKKELERKEINDRLIKDRVITNIRTLLQ